MTVAEKTLLLKQDFDDVKQAGRFNPIISSENLNGNVSGVAIAVNDVVDMSHNVGVKLSSKNLFDASLIPTQTAVNTGMSIEYEGDGIIHLYGTCATANAITVGMCQTNISVEIGSYYTVSATLISGSTSRDFANFFSNSDDIPTTVNWTNAFIRTTTTIGETTYRLGVVNRSYVNKFWVYIVAGAVGDVIDCRVRVQLEKGNVSTEYAPYINDFSGVEVGRYGKNLFDQDMILPKIKPAQESWSSFVWKKQADGSFFSGNIGTMHGSTWWENTEDYNGQIVLSLDARTDEDLESGGLMVLCEHTDGTTTKFTVLPRVDYKTYTLQSTEGKKVSRVYQSYQSFIKNHYIKNVMIAYGTDASYEPYIEPTIYQSIADGTVEGVTSIAPNMTLLSDNNGVVINAHYYKDPDIVISNLQQSVVLSGGE